MNTAASPASLGKASEPSELPWQRRHWELWEVAGAIPLAGFLTLLFYRTSGLPTFDTGLAYQGGQYAWQTGHPERLVTWISTPFLGVVMAVSSRAASVETVAAVVTLTNIALVVALLVAVWWPLRRCMAPTMWWLSLVCAVLFAPMASSVFWKQFNIMSLALALVGFRFASTRPRVSGLSIALSIGLKPLAILLPLALLWKRETRRSGVAALGFGAGLLALSQIFLAWRARSLSALTPIPALRNFLDKSLPNTTGWVCNAENFSPESTICRLVGSQNWNFERAGVLVAIVLATAWVAWLLRSEPGDSWWVFAFVCLCSPLFSPLAWSHYQIMMAPMLVLLAHEFSRRGASAIAWTGLICSFLLAELSWRPYGMLQNIAWRLATGTPQLFLTVGTVVLFVFAEFGQYVLLLTAAVGIGYKQARGPSGEPQLHKSASEARAEPQHHIVS